MTIERINAKEFRITDGDRVKHIQLRGFTCYANEYKWNGDGWLQTFYDAYGMSIPACEKKYGIRF